MKASPDWDTLWECYNPDRPEPARNKAGQLVRRDFVGWSGLGPLVMLPEDILGLDIDALHGEIIWHLSETGEQGVADLPFAGGRVDLRCEVADDGAFQAAVETDRPLRITLVAPEGTRTITRALQPGSHRIG